MAGWIKVHRDIKNHWLWEDKPFSRGQAFTDLLLMVNHKDNKILFNGELIEVKRGSRITSLRQLSDAWGWSTTKVKKFLEVLEKENMITVKSDNKKTLVIIENYGVYQDIGNTEETQEKQQSNTDVTQKKNKKNSKEIQKKTNKNDKEYIKNDIRMEKNEEEGKEVVQQLEPLAFQTPSCKVIYKSIGDIGYRSFFMNTEIKEDDKSIKIKANTDIEKTMILKYIPKFDWRLNKRVEVI